MSGRDSYRSTYESITDDVDFQRLSLAAQGVWWLLKLRLGQYGINVFYPETLPRLARAVQSVFDLALEELEQPKPGKRYGWLRREGSVYWLVNALRHEPSITLTNPNHAKGARKFAADLARLTRAPLVDEFVAYYGLATPALSHGGGDAESHTLSHGGGDGGMGGGITESETESETETESDTESERAVRAREASPPAPAADSEVSPKVSREPARSPLPQAAEKLLARCYPASSTSPSRRQAVREQLEATLTPAGIGFEGGRVHAVDADHLEAVCRGILARPIKSPNGVIRVVLLKLRDTETEYGAAADKHAHGETNGRRGKSDPVKLADVVQPLARATDEEIERYFAEHPAEADRIYAEVKGQFAGFGEDRKGKLEGFRDKAFKGALREAFERIHASAPAAPGKAKPRKLVTAEANP